MAYHRNETPPSSVHQITYTGTTDPTSDSANNVAAGKLWLKADSYDTPTYLELYRRNAANTAWVLLWAFTPPDNWVAGDVLVVDANGRAARLAVGAEDEVLAVNPSLVPAWLPVADVYPLGAVSAAMFGFGSGTTDPSDTETRGVPCRFPGQIDTWQVNTVDAGTGTITFDVLKNGVSMVGVGTPPALSAAAEAIGTTANWTTITFAAGDLLTVVVAGAPTGGPGETMVALGTTKT